MVDIREGPRAEDAESTRPVADARARAALVTFVVVLVTALPTLLILGRYHWFKYDEWDFLASRRGTSLHDLFEPHAVHWTTLPVLSYRALWSIFGIRSYVPYQVVAIVAHLAVAGLLRAVMRRAGVGPWTATALAGAFVLFGTGYENIIWAFQIAFTGAIALGLVQLMCADHDGPLDRRDVAGLLAGLLGLMFSGVAVTMAIIVGIAALLRRGWRVACFQTVPLAAVYSVWYLAIGHQDYENVERHGPGEVVRFVATATGATFDGLGQVFGVGWLIGAVLVGGLFVAWWGRSPAELRRVASAPAAMLAGAFVFLAITASGRVDAEANAAYTSRYLYVAAALALPALAIAADAIMRRWRVAIPLFLVALAVSLVGNVQTFRHNADVGTDFYRSYRLQFESRAYSPRGASIPRALHPDLAFSPRVSYGWMRDGARSGRIARPHGVTPELRASWETGLVVGRQLDHVATTCTTVTGPGDVTLEAGGSIRVRGPVTVRYTDQTGVQGLPSTFPGLGVGYVVAYTGPVALHVEPTAPTFDVCDPDGAPFTVPAGP